MEQYADETDKSGEVSDNFCIQNEEDKTFIDDLTQIESQPSDYFDLKYIGTTIYRAGEGDFSQFNVYDLLHPDFEDRNRVHPSYHPD